MVTQVSTSKVLHDHVEILSVLERRLHVDDEVTVDLLQDSLFIYDRGYTLLQQYPKIFMIMYFAFDISFMAAIKLLLFSCTFQT